MSPSIRSVVASWTTVVPVIASIVLATAWGRELSGVLVALVTALLAGAVLAAVHHAEVVAHRVGEPYGSLVLAVAVTVIEVALIVTLMISGQGKTETLARDTVFAAVMITCNGIVGLSILVGAYRRSVVSFHAEVRVQRLPPSRRWRPCVWSCPTLRPARWGRSFRRGSSRSLP